MSLNFFERPSKYRVWPLVVALSVGHMVSACFLFGETQIRKVDQRLDGLWGEL
jgi:hypothetical protein